MAKETEILNERDRVVVRAYLLSRLEALKEEEKAALDPYASEEALEAASEDRLWREGATTEILCALDELLGEEP